MESGIESNRPLSVGGNAVEPEDRTMGCSLHDNRLHGSVAIFFCPVLQFRGFDVTSERGLLGGWWLHIAHHTLSLWFNPFTPKSDQCQISPAASPEIRHHTVWRTWLCTAYSDEWRLYNHFSLPHLYISSLKGWENERFELGSGRVKSCGRHLKPTHSSVQTNIRRRTRNAAVTRET